jgi:hypothetical protein
MPKIHKYTAPPKLCSSFANLNFSISVTKRRTKNRLVRKRCAKPKLQQKTLPAHNREFQIKHTEKKERCQRPFPTANGIYTRKSVALNLRENFVSGRHEKNCIYLFSSTPVRQQPQQHTDAARKETRKSSNSSSSNNKRSRT